MNVVGHAVTAIPFAWMGDYAAAAMCLAPDLTWVPHEIAFRRSGVNDWYAWSERPGALRPRVVRLYRVVHALPTVLLSIALLHALGYVHARSIAAGWLVHILCDLPTHVGTMRQQPLYPFSTWRWPWTIDQ